MENGGEKGEGNLYSVLGLDKACSNVELRSAYKKLAMRWHPDRCRGSGDSKKEEAKLRFQEIQEAYSVLSDTNKRLLYDVGVYESDQDDNHGMREFMDELAGMMRKTAPCSGTPQESFAELQNLFNEMFEEKTSAVGASSDRRSGVKRDCAEASILQEHLAEPFRFSSDDFCFGPADSIGSSKGGGCGRRRERKHKASSRGHA